MPDRFQTRPERLAEERRREAQDERVTKTPLNEAFPYLAIPFPAEALGTRPLWSLDGSESSEN